MINLSDTTPAAPANSQNVQWQQDSAGNVSAYATNVAVKTTVAPVAGALTINASLGNSFRITVNAAITSTTITNAVDGQEITLLWQQDGTGHAIVLATNMKGATAPSTSANSVSVQKFTYDVSNTNWYGIAAGQTGL